MAVMLASDSEVRGNRAVIRGYVHDIRTLSRDLSDHKKYKRPIHCLLDEVICKI